MRVATIDVGTNSILLLVAERAGGALRVVDDRCRIERLGRGVDRTGVLDGAAIDRALDALREYAAAARAAGAERVAAVGTQALREAKNGAAFLEPAAGILGVPVEVIAGPREAALAYLAVTRSFPTLADGQLVVCDVGGGSTELIVGRAGAVVSLVSLPIGSVRMTERFLLGDPPAAAEIAAMTAAIDAAVAKVELPAGAPLVCTAGTATTLAAVSLALTPYVADRVQGLYLDRAEIDRQLARYMAMPVADRKAVPGLDPRRADVIAAGAAIIARVMARAQAPTIVVSDRGIRWGLAYELLGQ